MGAYQSTQLVSDLCSSYWNVLDAKQKFVVAQTCRLFRSLQHKEQQEKFDKCFQTRHLEGEETPDVRRNLKLYTAITATCPRWSMYVRLYDVDENVIYLALSSGGAPLLFSRFGEPAYVDSFIVNGSNMTGFPKSPAAQIYEPAYVQTLHSPRTPQSQSKRYMLVDRFLANFTEDVLGHRRHMISVGSRRHFEQKGVFCGANLQRCQQRIVEILRLLYPVVSLSRDMIQQWKTKETNFLCRNHCCDGKSSSCFYNRVGIVWTSDRPDTWLAIRDSMEYVPSASTRESLPTHTKQFDAPSVETIKELCLPILLSEDCSFYDK